MSAALYDQTSRSNDSSGAGVFRHFPFITHLTNFSYPDEVLMVAAGMPDHCARRLTDSLFTDTRTRMTPLWMSCREPWTC
jgi:hypothetical protein